MDILGCPGYNYVSGTLISKDNTGDTPSFPIISHIDDYAYIEGSTGNYLSWYLGINTASAVISIYRNGTQIYQNNIVKTPNIIENNMYLFFATIFQTFFEKSQ